MSAKYDDLRNVSTGRTDWRIRVRVVREWRGKTATGQPFTNYNLLLLDSKVCGRLSILYKIMQTLSSTLYMLH